MVRLLPEMQVCALKFIDLMALQQNDCQVEEEKERIINKIGCLPLYSVYSAINVQRTSREVTLK
jgi:hypothetical protein